MTKYYYEHRNLKKPIATLGGDIAKHLQLRQHLGSSLIICENPFAMLSATRKQWMRLSRLIQRRRASTLNAEEILRYTRSIMHMQHMHFVAKTPDLDPNAEVYFITPEEFTSLPPNCFSVYLTTDMNDERFMHLKHLPQYSLVVGYGDVHLDSSSEPLPKVGLEDKAMGKWAVLSSFFEAKGIDIDSIVNGNPYHSRAIDASLDTLLGSSSDFLHLAYNFQHALTLAQPLTTIDSNQQKHFDVALRLAHRVHALTPNILGRLDNSDFGGHDSYFLRDRSSEIDEILDHRSVANQPFSLFDAATIEE